jgi:hypothetical protein
MLSDETIVRTPTGDRPLSALRPVDQVFDAHNHVITVSVGASQPLINPHRVVFRPYHHTHNGLPEDVPISSFTADSAHQLHLVAPKYVKATLLRDKKEPEFFTIVEWRTRCVGYTSPEEQARRELAGLERPVVDGYLRNRSQDPAIPVAETLPSSPPSAAASSDPSYAPSSDVDMDNDAADADEQDNEQGDHDGLRDINENADTDEDEDEAARQAPNSDAFVQDEAYSAELVQHAVRRLASDRACQCGATRTFTLSCGSERRAALLHMALQSPDLSTTIDPQVVLPGEPHSLSIAQFMTSRHVKNPGRGEAPPGGTYIKLTRFPFETLPRGDTNADDLPIEAYFLGSWLGDGSHDAVRITSVDLDEARGYLAGYVDRLNASRAHGAAPLHLRITPHMVAEGSNQLQPTRTCFEFAISSTFREHDGFYRNPLRDGL